MKTKIINEQNLPKIKGTQSLSQYSLYKPAIGNQRQQPNTCDLIRQLGDYLSNHSTSQIRDLLEKCYIVLKKSNQKNESENLTQSLKANRKLITLGGKLLEYKQSGKQNAKTELGNHSVMIRKVMSKKFNRDQSFSGPFNDLTQNHSQTINEAKQIRIVTQTQIIQKMKLRVRQKQRDIANLKKQVQALSQKLKNTKQSQNASDKKENQKSQHLTVQPTIEIYYPIQIIEPSFKLDINMSDPELTQKYKEVCQQIEILRQQLNQREQQGIYMYTLLNADKD